jgi:hypothetical protein
MTTRYLRVVFSPSIHLPAIVPIEPTPTTLRHNSVYHRNTRNSHGPWRIGRSGGRVWSRRRRWSMGMCRSRGRSSSDRWQRYHPTTTTRPPSIVVSRGLTSRSRNPITSIIALITAIAIIILAVITINTGRRHRSRFTRLLRRLRLGSKLRRRLLRLLRPQPRRTTVTTPSTAIRPPWPSAPLLHRRRRAKHIQFLRSRPSFLGVLVSGTAFPGA